MSTTPLVSVITPTLNQARYIQDTLQSVREQAYGEVEHIVVDGGSSDETLEILEAQGRTSRLRWISGRDAGMYDAVNKGLRMARGQILAYLNSDDLYFPWTIQAAVDYLNAHPAVDLVYGDYMSLDEASGRRLLLLQPPYSAGYIRRTGFIAQPTVFWRRSLYEQIGDFDATLQYVGDCDYWMRAGIASSIAKVDEILAIDRTQEGGKRSTDPSRLAAELALVRRRHRRVGDGGRHWLDRAYAAFWRRVQLIRLLAQVARSRQRSGGWAGFVSGYVVRPHLVSLVLSFAPVVGARNLEAALDIRPRRVRRADVPNPNGTLADAEDDRG
jgi:glycosyltransferase involved in cell wall biosynthesis